MSINVRRITQKATLATLLTLCASGQLIASDTRNGIDAVSIPTAEESAPGAKGYTKEKIEEMAKKQAEAAQKIDPELWNPLNEIHQKMKQVQGLLEKL